MFRNLNAEQARFGFSNQQIADELGVSRVTYENKKKNGKFNIKEVKALCDMFGESFDYLFESEITT